MKSEPFVYAGPSSATFTRSWLSGIVFPCLLLTAPVASRAQSQQLSPDAVTFRTLFNFKGTNGADPGTPLVQGFDGNIYGTVAGTSGNGIFLKMTPGGSLTEVQYAGGGPGFLVLGADGNFYGAGPAISSIGTIVKVTPSGAMTTIYTFCALPNCADGYSANWVTFGRDGNIYGTTGQGGSNGSPGWGTVFKLTLQGTLTSLYSFCSQVNCADGLGPNGLIQGTDGNFYGTTYGGGTGPGVGAGVVFKITPKGTFTILHTFCSEVNCTDGQTPLWPPVQGADGDLYGTTNNGGANQNPCSFEGGCGSVYKITSAGVFSSLYSFCEEANCADGALPYWPLIEGNDGNFYGTTATGGAGSCSLFSPPAGCGTIFKVTPGGTLTTLHQFEGTDGEIALALMEDTNGSLYGTTSYGGTTNRQCSSGCGTIFRLSAGLRPFVELLPTAGKVGATVQILGSNLTAATAVSFNRAAAGFTVVSETQISATIPAGATSGHVTVTLPGGTLKSNVRFEVLQ